MKKSPINYALYLIKIKDRSEKSIEKRMREKGFDQADIKKTLAFLIDKKFIDDEKLAKNIVRGGLKNKLWGKYRIKKKLIDEGIPEEKVEYNIASISDEEETEVAMSILEIYKKNKKLEDFKDKQKFFSYLSRRGFGWDIISKVKSEID